MTTCKVDLVRCNQCGTVLTDGRESSAVPTRISLHRLVLTGPKAYFSSEDIRDTTFDFCDCHCFILWTIHTLRDYRTYDINIHKIIRDLTDVTNGSVSW